MIRALITLSIGLALLQCLSIEAAPLGLAALCDSKKVQLKSVAELEALKKEADASGAQCPKRVTDAIYDLAAIVKDKQACRMDKAQAITRFVDKYLKQSAEAIPEALANFAVAYGMQVSRICSEEMVDGFASDADARIHNRLSPDEYRQFLQFKTHLVDKSPVGAVLSSLLGTGQLVLPVDLLQVMSEMGLKEKLEIRMPESEQLDKFRGYCDNILRPLYESTLLPLAHLNRAGFTAKTSHKHGQHKRNSRFWSSVVFFCESLKTIVTEPVKSEGQAKDMGEIREMAEELASEMRLETEAGASVQLVADTPMERYESEQQVEDEVLNRSVKSLVKNFDANKSETERLREGLRSRSILILKALLSKVGFRSTFRKLIKLIRVKDNSDDTVRLAMSELVDSSESDWSLMKTLKRVQDEASHHERKGEPISIITLLALAVIACVVIVAALVVCAGCGGGRSLPSFIVL